MKWCNLAFRSLYYLIERTIILELSKFLNIVWYIYIIHLLIKSVIQTDEHDEAFDYLRLNNLPYQSYIPLRKGHSQGLATNPWNAATMPVGRRTISQLKSLSMKTSRAIRTAWKLFELTSFGYVPALATNHFIHLCDAYFTQELGLTIMTIQQCALIFTHFRRKLDVPLCYTKVFPKQTVLRSYTCA